MLVTAPMGYLEFTTGLSNAISWGSIGTKSLKKYKKEVFKMFEEQKIKRKLEYPDVSPFADENQEIQYISEVQLLANEVEFNPEDWLDEIPQNEEEVTEEVEEFTQINPFSSSVLVNPLYQEKPSPTEFREATIKNISMLEGYGTNPNNTETTQVVQEVIVETPKEPKKFGKRGIRKKVERDWSRFDGSVGKIQEVAKEVLTKIEPTVSVRPKVVSTVEEVKEETSIYYSRGMSLREFIKSNSIVTIEDALKYFERKEIMKNVSMGRVMKKGSRLFI